MIKICIYYPDLFNKGGCETLIKYVVRNLREEVDFYILTSLEGFREKEPEYFELKDKVEIINIRKPDFLKDKLREISPHILFTSFFHFATEPCKTLDIPVVEFCVGARVMPMPQANPLHNYMTVESEGAKKTILKLRRVEEQRVRVIRNTITYDGEVASKEEIRKLFGVPEDFAVMSLNARAVKGKGWFAIGEAMKNLEGEKIFFIGFSRIEEARSNVWHKITQEYNKLKNFRVLDGTGVERKYVLGVTSGSDFICLPTTHREEGIPNCIVEAIYSGKPVITCRNGYIEEIVKDGINGIFVKPDVKSLITGIKTLLHNKELRDSFSKESENIYNRLYRREFFKKEYLKVFTDAAEDGHFYGNMKKKKSIFDFLFGKI